MLLEELLRCQIHEWYPAFRRHSIPTVIIPLPAAFLRYLAGQRAYPNADADAEDDADEEPLPFLLPAITSGRQPFAPIHAHHPDPDSLLNSDLFFGSSSEDVFDPDADHPLRPEFPELEAAIDAAIAELGGAALPKRNWSAPKDATFMSADGTTQCSARASPMLPCCSAISTVWLTTLPTRGNHARILCARRVLDGMSKNWI